MDLHMSRAITNLRALLQDRGDNLDGFPEDVTDEAEWMTLRTTNKKYETDRTVVFFALTKDLMTSKDKKSLMASMKATEDFIGTHGAKIFILVFGETPASPVIQMVHDRDKEFQRAAKGACVQYFTMAELQYNPANHVLVPKHEKLTDVEVRKVMQDYQIKNKSQFPLIQKTDVMARRLGLKHGDIVRITRHNENSGIYYYYRCCV